MSIESISHLTYMVRHSPNCPKRFEVRLSGLGLLLERSVPRLRGPDDVGYGETMDEAAANAMAAKLARLDADRERAEMVRWAPVFREIWSGL